MDTWEYRSIRSDAPNLANNLTEFEASGWEAVNFVVAEWSAMTSYEDWPLVGRQKWEATDYVVLLKRRKPQAEEEDED